MLVKIYNDNPNEKEIQRIVNILRNGGIVIYPTDTIYGIGCDIFNTKGVETICKFKGIDPRKHSSDFPPYELQRPKRRCRLRSKPLLQRYSVPAP